MISIDVRHNLADVKARLGEFRKAIIDKAMVRALNKVGALAKTASSREIRDAGYNLKIGEIKDQLSQVQAYAGRLSTSIKVGRKTKPLINFGARQTKDGVIVNVLKQRKLIKHAFIGTLRNGYTGVFVEDKSGGKRIIRRKARKGKTEQWKSLAVKQLYGPSPGGAFVNRIIQRNLRNMIESRFPDLLAHEIEYLGGRL